jgi:hypothetical protein
LQRLIARLPRRFRTFGLRIEIEVADDLDGSLVDGLEPPGAEPTSEGPEHVWRLERHRRGLRLLTISGATGDCTTLLESAGPEHFEWAGPDAVAKWVMQHSPTHVFVHAGAVQVGAGVLVFPGPSYAGKSTLVHELVRLGAGYLSDDYAPVAEHGAVAPFPRPLTLRTDFGIRELAPGRVGNGGSVVGLVDVAYRPGARSSLREGRPAEAVAAMLPHVQHHARDPARTLRSLANAARGSRVLIGTRGEAHAAAERIFEQFGP